MIIFVAIKSSETQPECDFGLIQRHWLRVYTRALQVVTTIGRRNRVIATTDMQLVQISNDNDNCCRKQYTFPLLFNFQFSELKKIYKSRTLLLVVCKQECLQTGTHGVMELFLFIRKVTKSKGHRAYRPIL